MGADHSRFAVFILTHGRPDNVITMSTLAKSGYTGRVYLIVDNEDARGDDYRDRYGPDNVIEFDKAAVAETFDPADTQTDRRSIVYARNASWSIARDLGLDYFLQLDDDYTQFRYRWIDHDGAIRGVGVRSLNAAVEAMLTFLDDTGAATVAPSQGGDVLGGTYFRRGKGVLRKAMNGLFCRTDRPITFLGRINEDVTSYVVHGSRGALFLTVMSMQLDQVRTQQSAGGMTDLYLDGGTYVKSFYTVMMAPSAVAIDLMHSTQPRYHHRIEWDLAVPKILSPAHKKPAHDPATSSARP